MPKMRAATDNTHPREPKSGRLSGRVCLITRGLAGGVGRAAAVAFAREGASIVGCGRNVAEAQATVDMVRGEGGTMVSLQPCQLTNPADCQALVDFAVRSCGRIDVLFNNAGEDLFQLARGHHGRKWDPRSPGRSRPEYSLSPVRRGPI